MINQKNVAKFIQQYNDFEKIISDSNAVQARTVLEFEESLTLKDAEANQKLKVCRIVRNYIQHNDVNFVEPSKEMIDFIAVPIFSGASRVASIITAIMAVVFSKLEPTACAEEAVLLIAVASSVVLVAELAAKAE